jgi:MFS family permease
LLTTPSTPGMSAAAITALGLGQLVNWGVLYYAFAVLLLPVQHELGVPGWVVTGAFSLALLVSALLAPTVGRWSDRGHAASAILLGGIGGALLLALWALAPSVLTLYVAWAGLGICMATALYEPAFAIVTRAHGSTAPRLRALAIVTLYGGLASTVFLPVSDRLVTWAGWRGAVAILAGLLAASSALTALVVRGVDAAARPSVEPSALTAGPSAGDIRPLALMFGLSSLASASFIANLVPALGERGLPPASAAVLGGLFGVMQLPGRALMVNRRVALSGDALVAISLALQAVGLIAVAVLPTAVAVAVGVMAFAAGSGLTTLARPCLVHSRVAVEQAGVVNGKLARAQQLARAAGPIAASTAASLTSHAAVLASLGVALAAVAWRVAARRRVSDAACVHQGDPPSLELRAASNRRADPNEDTP